MAFGVWTTPRTYVSGEVHAASTLNTDHRDNMVVLKTSIANNGHVLKPVIQSKTATYTAVETDDVILCAGTFAVTLYPASGNAGRTINVKNSGTGVITIDGNASETIDGAATQEIPQQYMSLTLLCDGSNWHII